MKLNKKKVVVCGAGGFIGGYLVKSLLAQGAEVIRAVDIKPVAEWHQTAPGVHNVVLDLQEKQSCLAAAEGRGGNFSAGRGYGRHGLYRKQ